MKVAILGIGSELTDGQIVNRNAPWISQKLKTFGVPTVLHLVVPDERRLMHQGLELCAAEADVLFVTGGLGPTSDDFTRDIVAEWMGKPLVFHSPSWDHLSERLSSRGYAVKEIQRQQCYFPEGAEVLFNSEGTANAFRVQAHGKTVFVLPGPPREIEAVWTSAISAWLTQQTQHLDPVITRIWDTMGKGESEIATLAEEALQGASLEKGYRVHLPYVEVKLTFKKSEETQAQKWVDHLTTALQPYTVLRDGEDAGKVLADKMKAVASLKVTDTCSGSFLWHRLSGSLRGFMEKKTWWYGNKLTPEKADLELGLFALDPYRAEVTLVHGEFQRQEILESPYKTANMQERTQQYLAEKALIFWMRNFP